MSLQIAGKEHRLFPPHVMSMFNFKFPTWPIGHTHTLSLFSYEITVFYAV